MMLGLLIGILIMGNLSSVVALPATDAPELDIEAELGESLVDLDLDPEVIDSSPVLQRWLQEVPDVLSDIENDPSFRPRFRLGYLFDNSSSEDGILVGIEDIRLGQTNVTLSGDYRTLVGSSDHQYGLDLRYYMLPLGSTVNLAPVVGYRSVSFAGLDSDGINLGLKLLLVPSRTGAADVSLSQTWVRPGSDRQSISRSSISVGYAVTKHLRIASDIQVQVSQEEQETTFALLLEWLLLP